MSLDSIFLFALIAGPLMGLVLLGLALLHLLWGFNARPLGVHRKMLAGAFLPNGQIPGSATYMTYILLALFLGLAGYWPLSLIGLVPSLLPPWSLFPLGVIFWLVFLLRGVAGYEPSFQALHSEEPFATRNLWLYSPLCLTISACFALFTFGG